MQSRYAVHIIIPAEWRWVIFAGSGLVLLAFLPFLWVALSSSAQSNWQFMGMIGVNYRDGATYLAKMLQGVDGSWTVQFLHTPEAHDGFFLQALYLLLGHAARLGGLPIVVMFHIARVGAALFMYLAIYQLGATIWMRVRTRRIFFVIASVGAGFGWLFLLLVPNAADAAVPDISIPEAFPLFSTYVNVHFPLTIAFLSLLASVFIVAFRPGMEELPGLSNGGVLVILLTLLLGLLYPQTLVPLGSALILLFIIRSLRQKRFDQHTFYWSLLLLLPAAPLFVYYKVITDTNPILAEWNRQNVTLAPNPLVLVIGLGLPLLLALPAIYRALRRFEADGDQLMLAWLVAMLVAIYFPSDIQRRFAAGIMLVIAYFATRAVEDFWFNYIARRWRTRAFVLALPVMAFSQIFILIGPVLALLIGNPQAVAGMVLERDYRAVFQWLRDNGEQGDIILASPNVSIWLPGWTGERVIYGHPFETMQADQKRAAVVAWYTSSSAEECTALLNGAYTLTTGYTVRYILVGPEERALGSDLTAVESQCLDSVQWVARIGEVDIYAP
ncbi:MAG: hypothetical protein HXY40_12220 [Chloroflexi bacterium]|nr:hypothetical protein [Chloroflexota bacterium]